MRPRAVHLALGGTIFDKSTMAHYPLMYTSSRLLEPWRLTHWKQRRNMKGGTIFGKFTRMRYPWMDPPASQENAKWLRTMARRRNDIKRTRR